MCEAFYREREGELVARHIGCAVEIDVLWFQAEQRLWPGWSLIHVQPCLLALMSYVESGRRRRGPGE